MVRVEEGSVTFLFLVLWHEEPWLDISEISLLSNEKRLGPYHDISDIRLH
jgi:hypothetical protein